MKHSLTLAFITARQEPKFEWFLDSLLPQIEPGQQIDVICVDLYCREPETPYHRTNGNGGNAFIRRVPPKPTVWQGPHRLTKEDMWAKASALNTAICYCTTEWIGFVDDRCVLGPKSMLAIAYAMKDGYAVCGSYEKRSGMAVTDGKITDPGTLIGQDNRSMGGWSNMPATPTFGSHWYGCCNALPLEWCLQVNGYPEIADGMRYEDTSFGGLLSRSGLSVCFDPRLYVTQDRTAGYPVPLGMDKGVSPNDKSHKLIEKMGDSKVSLNDFDIRAMRNSVLAGNPFPIPTTPTHCWFDNQPISEMTIQ